jgi:hypothetical protein
LPHFFSTPTGPIHGNCWRSESSAIALHRRRWMKESGSGARGLPFRVLHRKFALSLCRGPIGTSVPLRPRSPSRISCTCIRRGWRTRRSEKTSLHWLRHPPLLYFRRRGTRTQVVQFFSISPISLTLRPSLQTVTGKNRQHGSAKSLLMRRSLRERQPKSRSPIRKQLLQGRYLSKSGTA